MKEDIHPGQLRAARALIGWSREELAAAAKTTERTVARMELGEVVPRASTVASVRVALVAAGVEFTNGDQPGVRLRRMDQGS